MKVLNAWAERAKMIAKRLFTLQPYLERQDLDAFGVACGLIGRWGPVCNLAALSMSLTFVVITQLPSVKYALPGLSLESSQGVLDGLLVTSFLCSMLGAAFGIKLIAFTETMLTIDVDPLRPELRRYLNQRMYAFDLPNLLTVLGGLFLVISAVVIIATNREGGVTIYFPIVATLFCVIDLSFFFVWKEDLVQAINRIAQSSHSNSEQSFSASVVRT